MLDRPWQPRPSQFYTTTTGVYLNGALYVAARGVAFPFNIDLFDAYAFLEDLA